MPPTSPRRSAPCWRTRPTTTRSTLTKLGRHLAYVVDPDGERTLAALEARLEAGRELFLTQHDDGSWDLRARLGPYAGAQLWAILDSLSAPRPSTAEGPDPRTAPQRRADALAEVCERQLAGGELPTQGGVRPTVIVTTTLEALQGQPGAPAPTLPDGVPMSVMQLRQISCDAGVIPVVMGADSIPTDFGRKRYTVPGTLRRAVLIRDGWRCIMAGCPNKPRHCHHIKPWERGGETEIDNLASLCGYHHRWIHQGREHLITPVTRGRPLVHWGGHDP